MTQSPDAAGLFRQLALAVVLSAVGVLQTGCLFGRNPATAPRPVGEPTESAAPSRQASQRQREIDDLVNGALTAPRMSQRTLAALHASDRAVAGLADTLAAIEAAEKVVVDNLRNADTVGYKAVRTAGGEGREPGLQLDVGQGTCGGTNRPLDVAIQGAGFFQVRQSDASAGIVFTRSGNLLINPIGELVIGSGGVRKIIPPVVIPAGTTEVTISQDGRIDVMRSGALVKQSVGRLSLVQFVNPSGLRSLGGGLYAETESSGKPVECTPGEGGTGQILQAFLEQSNVDLMRERLRLRFLQNWREAIFRAIDGEPRPAAGQPADAGRGDATR